MKFRNNIIGDFILEVLVPFTAIAVGFTVLFVAILGTAYAIIDPKQCKAHWGDRGNWSFWGGCMVETNRGRIPENMLNGVDIGVTFK
jgi:hypothetical protein